MKSPPTGEVELVGTVVAEPDVRETNTKLTIEIKVAEDRPPQKILVTVNRYPEYQYGDNLKINGKLQKPTIFDDFNYKNYLLKDGITAVIYYPKIEIRRGRTSTDFSVYGGVLEFKNKLREGIYKVFSPPQSEILGAMILGDKNRMSLELKEKLNNAGIRHITAVSGLHIMILSSILSSFLPFSVVIITIFIFVLIIGFQASAIRAGIMAGLMLLGRRLGRDYSSSRAVVLAAGVMLVINPLLLFYDVGFQLSFLAVLGIIYLGPYLKKKLKYDILASTFSAYIFTLPILLYNFGRISFIGPLVNVLVLPIIYWIMILGFVFVLIGLIFPMGAWLLGFPLWFLLTYIIKIINMV